MSAPAFKASSGAPSTGAHAAVCSRVASALAGPGRDVTDERLREAEAAFAAGLYAKAAARSADAIAGGATDTRILAYALFGAFAAEGPAAIVAIFEALRSAVTEGWEALRPEARKARVVDSALSGMFRVMSNHLEVYAHGVATPWPAPAAALPPRDVVSSAATALRAALEARITGARSTPELSLLEVALAPYFTRARAIEADERAAGPWADGSDGALDEDAPDTADEPFGLESPEDDVDGAITAPASGARAPGHTSPDAGTFPLGATLSAPMALLVTKLGAFERLLLRGDGLRAAIVAEDVRQVVDAFDPRVYLPELFVDYFRLLSAHIDVIAGHVEASDSFEWRALEQLYRVDPDGFSR